MSKAQRVSIRPRAVKDLDDIGDYIAEQSSDARSRAYLRKIAAKMLLYASQRDTGRQRNALHDQLRSFPVGNYVIFYFPRDDGLEIVRVLHGARDIDPTFFESDRDVEGNDEHA